jgi:hypothetical protein
MKGYSAAMCAIVLLLSGCQAMSEKECRTADWREVGVSDGRAGFRLERLERRAEACSKVQVIPDREQYLAGREQGLRSYCTPLNGFRLGKQGSSISDVCPEGSSAEFERAYLDGRRIYDAHERVEHLQEEQSEVQARLSKVKSEKDRRRLREELEELEEHLHEARDQAFHLEMSMPVY